MMSALFGMAPRLVIAVCVGQMLCAATAAAQSSIDFNVSGTSTVRGWTCSAKGTIAVTPGAAGAKPVPGFASGVQTATVTVPLKAFTCPNDEMRQHLLEAMKADKFPEIVFKLEKYDVTPGSLTASGAMTIVGSTQPVSFPVTLTPSAQGVEVSGNTRLEFKTFGLDPPTVMLGMLKVGPQIRIEFKGVVK
jgi:polyisoprenoid-binding protein YceI